MSYLDIAHALIACGSPTFLLLDTTEPHHNIFCNGANSVDCQRMVPMVGIYDARYTDARPAMRTQIEVPCDTPTCGMRTYIETTLLDRGGNARGMLCNDAQIQIERFSTWETLSLRAR